jgi:hypothetical protein
MKRSKLLYRLELRDYFNRLNQIPGVCSSVTIHRIYSGRNLAKLNKDQMRFLIEQKIQNEKLDIRTDSIKTVQVTLNRTRLWSLFTSWKFAYSYKGNAGWCSVFYMNL